MKRFEIPAVLLVALLLLALPAATNVFADNNKRERIVKIVKQEIKEDLRLQKQQLDAWIRFVREFAIPQLQEAIRTGDIATKTDILKTFASVKESSGRIAIMPNASIPSRGSNASVSGLFNVYIIKINAVELRAFEYCGLQFMCLFLDGDNTEESDRKGQKCDAMLANHAELVRQLLAALDGD